MRVAEHHSSAFTPTTKHYKGLQEVILEGLFTGRSGRQRTRSNLYCGVMKLTSQQIHCISITAMAILCTACGTAVVYKDEAFKKESPFQRGFHESDRRACEAAQRALLSQGYRIERFDAVSVRAQKDFQPDDEVNNTIDFDVTCKVSGAGSTVFANAVETSYKLKKASGAASLSVAGGGIALPWSKSADSLVKVSGMTIADEKFYRRFFDLVTDYLNK